MITRRFPLIVLLALILLPALLSGCGAGKTGAAGGDTSAALKMAPLSDMPEDVRKSSASVQQAYQFNVANPEIMKEIPCYCGCGGMGHTSNYQCYVKDDTGGQITFDGHALGCPICVDITLDTMRLLKEGKSVAEIRQYVDDTYSKFGPSNME